MAEDTRTALVRAGRPYAAETVFSHPSKLELTGMPADSCATMIGRGCGGRVRWPAWAPTELTRPWPSTEG